MGPYVGITEININLNIARGAITVGLMEGAGGAVSLLYTGTPIYHHGNAYMNHARLLTQFWL